VLHLLLNPQLFLLNGKVSFLNLRLHVVLKRRDQLGALDVVLLDEGLHKFADVVVGVHLEHLFLVFRDLNHDFEQQHRLVPHGSEVCD